jgi:hypothetical protein
MHAGTITVTLVNGNGHTNVTVTYELTALGADGEQRLREFAAGYRAFIQSWQDAIAALPRGGMTPAWTMGRLMADSADSIDSRRVVDPADKAGYELEFEDTFDGGTLDETRWLPYYLPQWSSRAASAARYEVGGGVLRLLIEADQPPWCPEFDGEVRVSSLQTGVFAGPVGSTVGQHRFNAGAVVRQAQRDTRLYTPQYGLFELRAKATDDPRCMVALWMIGYEDEPDRSAEICICEVFGRDVRPSSAAVGMGVHPFGDPVITEEFAAEAFAIDAREFHVYAAEWTPEHVAFFVDDQPVKTVEQAPRYPMQFMLGIYEFPDTGQSSVPTQPYPKQFIIDYFRGYRPSASRPTFPPGGRAP